MKYRELERLNKETGEVEKDIIINGTTTIVFGKGEVDRNLHTAVAVLLCEILTRLSAMECNAPEVKGVAKLSPEDTYDKKTGIKIASRKAELKARVKTYNSYADIINLLDKAYDLLDSEETKIGQRLTKICDELNMELVGVEEPTANA